MVARGKRERRWWMEAHKWKRVKKSGQAKGLSSHTFLHQLRKKGGQAKNRSSSARKEREKARVNACLCGCVYLSAGEGTG